MSQSIFPQVQSELAAILADVYPVLEDHRRGIALPSEHDQLLDELTDASPDSDDQTVILLAILRDQLDYIFTSFSADADSEGTFNITAGLPIIEEVLTLQR